MPHHRIDNLVFADFKFLHDGFKALLHQYPDFLANLHFHVFDIWLDCKYSVSYYGERHGCPNEEKLVFAACNLELEVQRGVFHFFVAAFVANFGAAEASLAARAVSDNVMSFFKQPLVPRALEDLPFPLDVAVLVGPVSFLLVDEHA